MVALLSLVSAAEASPRRMVCVGDLTDMRIIGVSIGSNVDDRGSYCSLNEISLRVPMFAGSRGPWMTMGSCAGL